MTTMADTVLGPHDHDLADEFGLADDPIDALLPSTIPEQTQSQDRWLDRLLNALSNVTEVTFEECRYAIASGKEIGLRPLRALVDMNVITLEQIESAEWRERDSVRITEEMVDWEVAGLVGPSAGMMHSILPYTRREEDGVVLVARHAKLPSHTVNTLDDAMRGEIYELVWTSAEDISNCWSLRPKNVAEIEEEVSQRGKAELTWHNLTRQSGTAKDQEANDVIQQTFFRAISRGASDIHINSMVKDNKELYEVRFREMGEMIPIDQWRYDLGNRVLNRFRIVAGIGSNLNALADARFAVLIPKHGEFSLRLSFSPTSSGQMLVMRLLSTKQGATATLDDVWPNAYGPMAAEIKEVIKSRPYGIVLVVGKTGDGKSTTLASMVKEVCDGTRKVVTAENPVEYLIPGAEQVEIQETREGVAAAAGQRTWGNVLRSFLRSDPDVIVIGEIRDQETAEIAIRAAQTGHTVFATLHVHDAASAPARLLDMAPGNETLLAESLNGVVSQRLVRRLCVGCQGTGEACTKCQGKGYDERIAVGELLVANDKVRRAIGQPNSPPETVRDADPHPDRLRLTLAGLVKSNIISVKEVERVFGKLMVEAIKQ